MPQHPKDLTPEAGPWHLFGDELRRLRTAAGLSQNALGERTLYSGDVVSKVEKAERRPHPSFVAAADAALEAGELLIRLHHAIRAWEKCQRSRSAPRRRGHP